MRESRSAARHRRIRSILRRIGVRFLPHHVVVEGGRQDPGMGLDHLPPGFTCTEFGEREREEIALLEARRPHVDPGIVRDRAGTGAVCLGLRDEHGEIVAFTWHAVGRVDSPFMPTPLGPREAYLFDIWVSPARRGQELAPMLRRRAYRYLAERGIDTCYSVTQLGNDASARFKAKLGAEVIRLAVHLDVWGRWRRTVTLRHYARARRTPVEPAAGG